MRWQAANNFKLAKLWEEAGAAYLKLGECHKKLDSKHELASSFVDAANSYKKTNPTQVTPSRWPLDSVAPWPT